MKAFVSKSTNELRGSFTVERIEDISTAFGTYAAFNPVSPYDYLECEGHVWTVLRGANGELELKQGRHPAATAVVPPHMATARRPFVTACTARYRTGYAKARYIVTAGVVVERFGMVLAIAIFLFGMIPISKVRSFGDDSFTSQAVIMLVFYAVLTGIMVFSAGVFLRSKGEALHAALDASIHTSHHLTTEEAVSLLAIGNRE